MGFNPSMGVRDTDSLCAGQIVIPGSAVELVPVEPGDRVAARFTHVGCVEAVFRERLQIAAHQICSHVMPYICA